MPDSEEENDLLTLDELSMWKTNALRDFLRKRNLPNASKTKSELAALVYGAMHLGLKPVKTAVELEQEAKREYSALLVAGDIQLTDPLTIQEWAQEKDSTAFWPKTLFADLTLFIRKSNKALSTNMYSKYKQGKAFSYFHDGWIMDIHSHQECEKDIIYFRTKCMPSERIHAPPHEIWIAAIHSTGEVLSCYCTCTAGLGSSCNHIAAAFFKLDYISSTEPYKKSCTDGACNWRKSTKKTVVPKMLKDIVFVKPNYSRGASAHRSGGHTNQPDYDTTSGTPFDSWVTDLMDVLPSCTYLVDRFDAAPDLAEWQKHQAEAKTKDIAGFECYVMSWLAERGTNFNDFLMDVNSMPLDDSTIEHIQNSTMNQSHTPLWQHLRQGRITASNFYRVLTKTESIVGGKKSATAHKLIANLLNPPDISNSKSVKHGKITEPVAREAYVCEKKSEHPGLEVSECGIFLSTMYPYLGASPDAIVQCDCCGKGLVEIKCPVVTACPSYNNVGFLKKSLLDSNKSVLSKKHPYYGQIQGQMFICKLGYCDLYVYSEHGSVTQRIHIDKGFCERMFKNLKKFYFDYFALAFYESCVISEPVSKSAKLCGDDDECYSELEVKPKVAAIQNQAS